MQRHRGSHDRAARNMNVQALRNPWRRMLGLAIFLGGAAVLLSEVLRSLQLDDPRMRGALTDGAGHAAGAAVAPVFTAHL